MVTAQGTARWCDDPITPSDYDDIRSLVKAARRARTRTVEFEWVCNREDLQGLREAVFRWGGGVVGSYKCFDARMLKAINEAFGDPSSMYCLNEPKNTSWTNGTVKCTQEGEVFRLHGRASFDLVFGYGEAGVREGAPGTMFLTPAMRETLANSIGMLGWDLRRLQDPRYGPIRNAMYDIAPAKEPPEVTPDPRPALEIDVRFQGPFSVLESAASRCLFRESVARKSGVYLATIEVGGVERPWYVGQTARGFGQRISEHIRGMLSGEYATYDAEALLRGECRFAQGTVKPNWPETLPSFLASYEQLAPHILGLIRMSRFRCAVLPAENHVLDRVEGAIGRYFENHPVPAMRFVAPGIRLPAAYPGERRMRLVLSSEVALAFLPMEILEPRMPLPQDVRGFVESTPWTFAKTYAATWPHEYVVRTPENAPMILALATHIFEHGVSGRFYSTVRRYHHEGGKVYWSMDSSPEATDLINRCDESQTYQARVVAGTLPK